MIFIGTVCHRGFFLVSEISADLRNDPFVLSTDGSQEGGGIYPIVVTVERVSLCDKKIVHVLLCNSPISYD